MLRERERSDDEWVSVSGFKRQSVKEMKIFCLDMHQIHLSTTISFFQLPRVWRRFDRTDLLFIPHLFFYLPLPFYCSYQCTFVFGPSKQTLGVGKFLVRFYQCLLKFETEHEDRAPVWLSLKL